MTIAELLSASGLPNLESELLAAFALRQERTWVIAHASDDLTSENIERCQGLFNRRRNGEPLAYITGTKEFYGREFRVTPAVLIPRQSTEILIDQALSFNRHPENSTVEADSGISIMSRMFHDFQQPSIVVDIGTGSGIIAITLALERPDLSLIATDISGAALRVARQNAADFGVINRIDFRKGSMLDPLNDLDEPFLIFANPPYILSLIHI